MKHVFYMTFVVLLLLGVTFGCGDRNTIRTIYVEGTVTYNGAPVDGASVRFSPVTEGTGSAASGRTNEKGVYTLQTHMGAPGKGTTAGEYIVTISKKEGIPTGRFQTSIRGEQIEIFDFQSSIPAVYDSHTKSPLRATVAKGESNKFDFELVD